MTLHSPLRAMIACHTPHAVVVPTRSGFSDVRARDYSMKRGAGQANARRRAQEDRMQDVLLTAAHLFILSVLLCILTFFPHLASPTNRNANDVSSRRPVLGLLQRFTGYASGRLHRLPTPYVALTISGKSSTSVESPTPTRS